MQTSWATRCWVWATPRWRSRCSAGLADAREAPRPRPPRHAHQHEQPGRGLPGRRQARPGPAAVRGDAQAPEGEARPRPSRHAQQHEQPGQRLPGTPASWTWPCRSSRRRSSCRKAKLGPDHPDTLTSMNNLAVGYQDAGKLDLALPLYEETLKLMKAKLGPDHPDTLTSMNNLAVGLPGRRQAGPGPAALRGDAQAHEGQARPRPPRHARQHEQPGLGLFRPHGQAGDGPVAVRANSSAQASGSGPMTRHVRGLACTDQPGLTQDATAWAEAEPLLRECLAIREKTQPDGWTDVQHAVDAGRGASGPEEVRRRRAAAAQGLRGDEAAREDDPAAEAQSASPKPSTG